MMGYGSSLFEKETKPIATEISLRDYFAAHIIGAAFLASSPNEVDVSKVYRLADVMVEESKNEPQPKRKSYP